MKKNLTALGFSLDKRKRRRQHRVSARQLSGQRGGTIGAIVNWHLLNARYFGR